MTHLTRYKSLAVAALVAIAPVAAAQTYATTAQEAEAIRIYQAQQRASAGYVQPQVKPNTLTVTPVTTVVTPSANNPALIYSMASHTVAKGDTLYNIGQRYGAIKPSAIMNANKMTGSHINIGQILIIPGQTIVTTQNRSNQYLSPGVNIQTSNQPSMTRVTAPLPEQNVHAVLPGDTLYSIARRSCAEPGQIAALSKIPVTGILQPGQILRLPVGHCAP